MIKSLVLNTPAVVVVLWLFGLCAMSVSAEQSRDTDPYQNINQTIFSVNQSLDDHFARPLAKMYVDVTPDVIETAIANVFDNLDELTTVFNHVLQAKFAQAANHSGRFGVNSTLGLVGFFDVASLLGLKKSDSEDFGQTLGYWGVPEGPYLMLPLLGPSTMRDAPTKIVDRITDPLNYLDQNTDRMVAKGAGLVVKRAALLEYDTLLSGDSYTLVRDVYLQRRAYQVNDGRVEDEFDDLDDY
jgi:phospholipid-binding lipoprotein MlaA